MVEWEYLVKADPGNAPMFPPMDGDRFEDEIDEIEKNAKALLRFAKTHAGHRLPQRPGDNKDIDNMYNEILNSLNQLLSMYHR